MKIEMEKPQKRKYLNDGVGWSAGKQFPRMFMINGSTGLLGENRRGETVFGVGGGKELRKSQRDQNETQIEIPRSESRRQQIMAKALGGE